MKEAQSFPPSHHPLQGRNRQTFHLPSRLCHRQQDQGQFELCAAGARSGTPVPVRTEQLHHITRFGVIHLVLIQLQKFGKHFVNNLHPGRLMLSQSGSS